MSRPVILACISVPHIGLIHVYLQISVAPFLTLPTVYNYFFIFLFKIYLNFMSQLKTSVTQALPHYPSPWDCCFLYPVTNAQYTVCVPQWSTWVTRVCYKHAMSCYPFCSSQYSLLMPVPAWEAFPSVKPHQLSELDTPLPCALIILFIHTSISALLPLGPLWNIFTFYSLCLHTFKQLLHFTYSSAKNYAWYRPDVQCMFEEVSFNKALLFSHF